MITEAANVAAPTSTSTAPTSTPTIPGRTTTKAPAKPTPSATRRGSRITSPSKMTARMVVNSGIEKFSDANVANGIRLSAIKCISMVATWQNPRRASSPIRCVRSGAKPRRARTGTKISSPNAERIPAIWNGCISLDRYRTQPFMAAKAIMAAAIKAMPRTAPGPSRNA
jgi:hypothetical protein